ncbi:site-2 protease family protein [Myxococcus stipitatus]|uniref:M50 family metallopeptidase n=1 Tax=Myxococcus stipitatus TaxID=83455 RepID=UPI001F31E534|nr:M50 family metallopeptidase [Myxococcus stipitatus]MCE9666759.1 site-2 protease family protein [Myxococcus stipitatus]
MQYALVLLALGVLLALHELGHLVAARLLGVRVPRFVFGFGPPLMSFRLWGTQFVVGAVPLGGTAHLQGMNPHRADAAESASFRALGPLRRIVIILAGPLTNYLVALGILFALYTSGTHVVVPMTVGTVTPGSEAARAQLLPGDRIQTVDGQAPRNWSEFVERVAVGVGKSLELKVDRHGETRTVTVRPRPDERGEGRIGVSQQYVYRAHAPGEALGHAFTHTTKLASEGVAFFVRVVNGESRPGAAAGPGALVRQESSDAISSGADSVLRALVAASLALALLTLLPVPGLDGGRVLLLLVEAASGRRLPPRVETVAQTLGFLAISAGVVFIAAREIRGALPERFLWGASPAVATATPSPAVTTTALEAAARPDAGVTLVASDAGTSVVTVSGGPPQPGAIAVPATGVLPVTSAADAGAALTASLDAGPRQPALATSTAVVGTADAGAAEGPRPDAGSTLPQTTPDAGPVTRAPATPPAPPTSASPDAGAPPGATTPVPGATSPQASDAGIPAPQAGGPPSRPVQT